jgi:hypothetical protein
MVFDIGKPIGTPHPVGQRCPTCGSDEHRKVNPAAFIAFTWDRVCRVCATRYTPPTPVWARCLFAVIGLGAVALAVFWLYSIFFIGQQRPILGLAPVVVALVGLGCLYKAVTR